MISRTEFEQSISREQIRVSQIIHIALALGVTMFFAVIVFLYATQPQPANGDHDLIRLLCYILAVFAMSCYVAAFILYKKQLSNIDLSEKVTMQDGSILKGVGDVFVTKLRTAQIIRVALFEGAAFFGLSVCMLAVIGGVMQEQPLYWLTALPAFFVVLLLVITLPTKEKVVEIFESYQSQKGRL